MPARCLSIHAAYACRHSGACCSDRWAVPVEPAIVDRVTRAGIRPVSGSQLFVRGRNGGSLVVAHANGACVFFDRNNGRLCAIHRDAGVDALPSSCRHFPRVYLRDDRGLHLSLSHFCPTAAAMLLEEMPMQIADAQPPLALDGAIEGLDAVGALPPLLRPDLLMDLAAYDAWERAAVATFARSDVTYEEALTIVSAATEAIRTWTPGPMALEEKVREAFRSPSLSAARDASSDAARLDLVDASCPADVQPVVTRTAATPDASIDPAIRRYLAARLFANWIAYRGRGLRSIVEWLRICLAVLRAELAQQRDFIDAVRETDRVMLHVVDSQKLARLLIPLENA